MTLEDAKRIFSKPVHTQIPRSPGPGDTELGGSGCCVGFLAWGARVPEPCLLLAMQKLTVPTGLSVTSPHKRTWFIPPLGSARPFPPWMMVAAAVPALLVLILIFMETQITA